MRKHFVILSIALMLTACDTFYGIHRSAAIRSYPNPTLVEKSIRTSPEIDSVRYERVQGADVFRYSGTNNIRGFVAIHADAIGRNRIEINYVISNFVPPQDVIDRNYCVMLKVEEQIEKQCGLDGLSKIVKETSSPKMKHKNALPISNDGNLPAQTHHDKHQGQ